MPWRIFATDQTTESGTLVELRCIVTQTEEEARGCAVRLCRDNSLRVMVRSPHSSTILSGLGLRNWLVAAELRKLKR